MLSSKNVRTGILVVVGLAVALGLGIRLSFLASDRIAPGVCVGGVPVGGLTRPEAVAQVKNWSRGRLNSNLTLIAADKRWSGALIDIGVIVDVDRMVDNAYSIGRKGNFIVRYASALWMSRGSSNMPAIYRCDRDKIDSLVRKIDSTVASPAKDAQITFTDGARSIIPELPGTKVDPTDAFDLIKIAVERNETLVMLPIVLDNPEVTTADLEQVDTLLASYTTRFPSWRRDRTHNVKLATTSVNGKLVRPGEVFSYNDAVGPRLKANGFKDALIYFKGKMIPGTGGGVCQVSSTVYNAALLANLEITERSNHSMPVPYVPLGRDATVAYGIRDLKFKNTTSAPIYLTASITGSRLNVSIYGSGRDKKNVSIITTRPKRIQRPSGTILTTVTVYRIVNENGAEALKERVSYDRYQPAPPHPTGTKPKPHKPATQRTQA
jgi:vancomycin resistance protein YoaR